MTAIVGFAFLFVACSESLPSAQDGNLEVLYTDGDDVGFDAGMEVMDTGGDLPPEEDLQTGDDLSAEDDLPMGRPRLIIEPNAVACGVFDESSRDWRLELALLGRVEFRSQAMLLPTDGSTWDLDLVEEVLFGPEAIPAVSQGSGRMMHQMVMVGDEYFDRYTYTHSFSIQGDNLALEANLIFGSNCDEIRFTDDFLGTARNPCIKDPYFHFFYSNQPLDLHGILNDGLDPTTQLQTYSSCMHKESPLYEIEAVTSDQDRIRFNKRYYTQTFASGPVMLVWAQVTLAGTTHEVDNYFSLVYSAIHHNWREEYLLLLDQPIGPVHGVLIERDNQEAVFLDADLKEQTRKTLVEYTGDSPSF